MSETQLPPVSRADDDDDGESDASTLHKHLHRYTHTTTQHNTRDAQSKRGRLCECHEAGSRESGNIHASERDSIAVLYRVEREREK